MAEPNKFDTALDEYVEARKARDRAEDAVAGARLALSQAEAAVKAANQVVLDAACEYHEWRRQQEDRRGDGHG
jgi:ElaB/YqjD/DUF883 family membrane-anchored ribosome-binding protein